MKKIIIVFSVVLSGFLTGCLNDDFLDRQRLTEVSPEAYFTKPNDFKLYTNQFYNHLGNALGWNIWVYGWEDGTDNLIGPQPNVDLDGQITIPVTDAQWSDAYSRIRSINILLANTGRAKWEDIKIYVAEAKFFRAFQYFALLRRYGDVPWVNKPIIPSDIKDLTIPRLSRDILTDSIVADLDFAVENLPDHLKVEKFRISKEIALAFKSRVCLYEGTWEKYHGKAGTPFAVTGSDGKKFLQLAMNAAQDVINSGQFSIYKQGDEPYYNFFNQDNYTTNKEVLLWRQNDRNLIQRSFSRSIWLASHSLGLTKNLVDAYLCTDGKPVSLTSLTISDAGLTDVVINRDPRLAQTIFHPGVPFVIDDVTSMITEEFKYPNLQSVYTGYQFRKGGSVTESFIQVSGDQIGLIYFRYAEVLLNYIEAKAELNEAGITTLNQNDFDITINALRDRVAMPHFNYSEIIIDSQDPFTGQIPWYLVEIRRERRVELALEGFRKDDIFRFAAAEKLIKGKVFRGAKFQWFVDMGYYPAGSIAYVDSDGYLSPWHNTGFETQGGYQFNINRDYLYPIPSQEMLLGEYGKNNPGWN